MLRKLVLLSFYISCSFVLNGQVNYSFSASTSTFEPLFVSFGVPDEDKIWEGTPSEIPIGFTFKFYENTYTSVYVNKENISFDADQKLNISAYRAYLDTTFLFLPSVHYTTDGTVGNRILKIEWQFVGFHYGTPNDQVGFQLWLYETSNKIEVHIGHGDYSSAAIFNGGKGETGPYIGLDDLNNNVFYYLAGNPLNPTSSANITSLASVPDLDQVYTFTPSGSSSSSLSADFIASDSTICSFNSATSGINFFYNSADVPTGWQWYFQGGTPNSSTEKNPQNIKYNMHGVYSVTLTVSNATTSNTLIKTSYIKVSKTPTVTLNPSPSSTDNKTILFKSSPNPILLGGEYGWNWDFGDPVSGNNTSSEQNPSHTYSTAGTYTACVDITHPNGCTSESKCAEITILNVGINDLMEEYNITTYPNPIENNILYIKLNELNSEEIIIKLTNIQGKLLLSEKAYGQNILQLNLSDYSKGVYFVKITTGNRSITKKIFIN